MGCESNGVVRVNQFALVSYIPGPLGQFLDKLRLVLAPECRPHAHVTVLPPRPVQDSPEIAGQEVRAGVASFSAFDVRLGPVSIFPVSEVIYLQVELGATQLREMHAKLNLGAVCYQEPFEFHPHITLAQNLPHDRIGEAFEKAREMWAEWRGSRSFTVDELAFVQNTQQNIWLDLLHLPLVHEHAGAIR